MNSPMAAWFPHHLEKSTSLEKREQRYESFVHTPGHGSAGRVITEQLERAFSSECAQPSFAPMHIGKWQQA